jgi:hypothetical protein
MIHETKFVRNVLSVNQIPNQIPHINIDKFTPNIHRVIENQVINIVTFTTRLINQTSSGFPESLHHKEVVSKYHINFVLTIAEARKVNIITTIANTKFSNVSVENNHSSVFTTPLTCSISFSATAADTLIIAVCDKMYKKLMMRYICFIKKIYVNYYTVIISYIFFMSNNCSSKSILLF